MNNFTFKSKEDFESKKSDVSIIIDKAKKRLRYIAECACQILNTNIETDDHNDEDVFVSIEQIFDLQYYNEEADGFLHFHFGTIVPKNTLFKDKFGNKMDFLHQIPRRWLWEDFYEELKNGLYIYKDENLEKLIINRDKLKTLAESLNIPKETRDLLGITAKIKEAEKAVDYYSY